MTGYEPPGWEGWHAALEAWDKTGTPWRDVAGKFTSWKELGEQERREVQQLEDIYLESTVLEFRNRLENAEPFDITGKV